MKEELGDVKVIHSRGVRVRACEWDREKSAPEGLLVSDGIGFVFFQHTPIPDREEKRREDGFR